MRRSILSISAVSLLLLAGCASAAPVAEEVAEPVSSPTAVASPTPEPVETTAPPVAVEREVIGSQAFGLEYEGGYTASALVEWYAAESVAVEDARECLDVTKYPISDPSGGSWTMVTARISGSDTSPPGFQFPDVVGWKFVNEQSMVGGVCSDDTSDAGIGYLDFAAPLEMSKLYFVEKTPDNPEGALPADFLSTIELKTNDVIDLTCDGKFTDCVSEFPSA